MSYLKSKEELEKELYLELKNFVNTFGIANRDINEENYYITASQILVEAERIDQYYDIMDIVAKESE